MPDYSVKFLIDPNDLNFIKAAQQRITLAKPVNGNSPNVIWLSVDPFQSTDIGWSEEYGIYASTSQIANGVSITKLSETGLAAQDGMYYTLTAATTFNGPFAGGGVPRGSFGAQNDVPYDSYPSLTFGLTQEALVTSETIITRITGKYTKIALGGGKNDVTLKYDPTLGMFVQSTTQGKLMKEQDSSILLSEAVF
jgi:hypothetical protein